MNTFIDDPSAVVRITDHEIVDHGINWPDYFRGCGTYGTGFEYVVTGHGDNPLEAIEEALEIIAGSDPMPSPKSVTSLEEAIYEACGGTIPEKPSAYDQYLQACFEEGVDPDQDHCPDLPYYYVSIRYNVEKVAA